MYNVYEQDTMKEVKVKVHPMISLRERLNMSQQEFASALGLCTSTVSDLENGKIKQPRLTPPQFLKLLELANMEDFRAVDAAKEIATLLGYDLASGVKKSTRFS